MAHVSEVFRRSFPDADQRWVSWGIDVSGHQPSTVISDMWSCGDRFDWVLVKASEGRNYKSEEASRQVSDCKLLGLPFGLYHFLNFSNSNSEAENFINAIENLPAFETSNAMPIALWLDAEDGNFEIHNVENDYTGYMNAVAVEVGNHFNTKIGIYTGAWWADGLLTDGTRSLWVSDYDDQLSWPGYPNPRLPEIWSSADLWQFTSESPEFGNLDLNAAIFETAASQPESITTLGNRWLFSTSPMLYGQDVADLQQRLFQLGYNPGDIDGIFGPLTEGAVVAFQQGAGLDDDGIVGPLTAAALFI